MIKEEADERFGQRQIRAGTQEVIDLEMVESDPDDVVHVEQREVAAHGQPQSDSVLLLLCSILT